MNLSGKKLLVLGATGAMGQYLVPVLAEKGFLVDAVSLDTPREPFPGVNYIKSDAKEWSNLCKLLENRYDGIVDFMIYPTGELATYLPLLLDNTDHYIYLSSYRIYDNKEHPIRESSPRLLDSSEDVLLRNTDDYCIYKARGENILRASQRRNWTIVRPGGLSDEPASGNFCLLDGADRSRKGYVSRGDVAAAVLRVLDDPVWLYRAVTVQCDKDVEDAIHA